jgi:MoxR-like ATPase
MSEAELHVPRLGRISAADGFRLVAAMNPFDAIGTARISSAVYDRVCRIAMGYQTAADEQAIVGLRGPLVPEAWRATVVELVRRTRTHPEIRVGSSVRGSIDLVRLAAALAARRGVGVTDRATGLDAALVALAGRIQLADGTARTAEEIVCALYDELFPATPEEPSSDDTSADETAEGDASGGA